MTTRRRLSQPLRGIISPMVTPLVAADQLDPCGLERLIEHVITGGVHGVFVLGTCGEGPSLSPRLRRHLVDRVCQGVNGRVPVLVSITDTSSVESAEFAAHAADAGADAVVLAPPYYLPVDQTELRAYVQRLIRAIPLPVVLYNTPELTQVTFEAETVRQLMQEEPIIGLKDSSGDLAYFQRVRQVTRERPDWSLLMGPEHLLARSIELGGDGGVSGGANIWPQLFVQIYEAGVHGHREDVSQLVEKADRLGEIYRVGPSSAASVIKGLKTALSVLGICDEVVAEPLSCLSSAERHQVERILSSLGLEPVCDVGSAKSHC